MSATEKMNGNKNIPSSFRDPSGFLFYQDGVIYRQINHIYKENYDFLTYSGLYKTLVDAELLIHHEEVDLDYPKHDNVYKIIRPEPIQFVSYPYEWCFSQLKDAALLTLEIQKKSLNSGMILKDASAYNIQFRKGKPIFIDTLSFEKYCEGKPWAAYRQFCQHFLAPLALMRYTDMQLNQLFRVYIDGVPLYLASKLLPFQTRLKFSLLTHIHLHAKSQKHFADTSLDKDKIKKMKKYKFSHTSMLRFVDYLESAVKKLKWKPQHTEWGDYYEDTNYSKDAIYHKKELVAKYLDKANAKIVWDLGANIGLFSRIASDRGIQTISFDIDSTAVEKNYLKCVGKGETNNLPLLRDLTNPSPNMGWQNRERMSIIERNPADTVFALALIHHLAISNNLPLNMIADFFSQICNTLIIEFVPKNDSQVQRLLSFREDIFPNYTQRTFEKAFDKYFAIQDFEKIRDTKRTLYLMEKR